MIEIKNNYCISLAKLQSVPYDFFMESVFLQKFRCINAAARRKGRCRQCRKGK